MRKTGLSLLCLACAVAALGQENYAQWAHYKDVTVTAGAIASDLIKFPLLVRLASDNADVFAQAAAGGSDLRFSKPDGKPLAYEIERWDAAAKQAEIWVSADTVRGNGKVTSLRMLWGKAGAADSSKGAAVFDKARGYQAVWHLEASLSDASGNVAPGENHGSVDAAGMVGRGRSFNGTSAYVALGNPPSLNFGGIITLEAWVRWLDGGTSGTQGRRHILTHGNGAVGAKKETVLRLLKDTYFTGSYNGVDAAVTAPIAGDSALWQHLVGQYDGAAWRLFKNGAEIANKANVTGALVTDTGWFLGTWSPVARFFSGDIDEVRVSSVARSADWIKLEYANQKSGQTVVALGPTQNGSSAVASPRLRAVRPGAAALLFRASGAAGFPAVPFAEGNASVTVRDLSGRLIWSRPAAADVFVVAP